MLTSSKPQQPFGLPDKLEASLAVISDYWNGLKRGGNDIPFWDDVNPSVAARYSDSLILIEVMANPPRFRFGQVGERVRQRYGADLPGRFADEIEIRDPFDYLIAQCSVTVEARLPTYFRAKSPVPSDNGGLAYSRIIFPLWGGGRIEMLLGAIA